MRSIASALLVATAAIAGAPAGAADLPRGAQLANVWCGNCHIVDRKGTGHAQDGVPSLPEVAKGGMSPGALRAFLSHPHGKMPDLSLTRADIDDLIAYIQALR